MIAFLLFVVFCSVPAVGFAGFMGWLGGPSAVRAPEWLRLTLFCWAVAAAFGLVVALGALAA